MLIETKTERQGSARRHMQRCLLAMACVAIAVSPLVQAEQKTDRPSSSVSGQTRRVLSDYYCGLYSLYTTMRLADKNVEFKELINPEYLGTGKGSSIGELAQAARDFGMYAEPVQKMSCRDLRACPYPVVLHVKAHSDSTSYSHFRLFLGVQQDKIMVFDASGPVELVADHELASLWDGKGLVVSENPIDLGIVFRQTRVRFALFVVGASIAVIAVRWSRRRIPLPFYASRSRRFGLSAFQAGTIALATLAMGVMYHFVQSEGFLSHAGATESIQRAHRGHFMPKVAVADIPELLCGSTVFIDARFAADFDRGHLAGAINVPIDANDFERRHRVADIAKNARMVIYCQSAGCKYAEQVAVKLMADGFSDISLFKGGWREWADKNQQQDEVSS